MLVPTVGVRVLLWRRLRLERLEGLNVGLGWAIAVTGVSECEYIRFS